MNSLTRSVVLGLVFPVAVAFWGAPAQAYGPFTTKVEILVNGRPLPFEGATGNFATVRQFSSKASLQFPKLGQEYQIRVTNQGSRRIVVVVAVDGLSVMNRQPAASNEGGYILLPHQSYAIAGWRIDNRRVKAFEVTRPEASEAAQQGQTSDIGVISITAIEEYTPMRWMLPGAGTQIRALPGAPAGTGAGRPIDSRVVSAPFERGSKRGVLQIHYDAAAPNLIRE